MFNNREIATAILIAVLALWMAWHPSIRKSTLGLIRACFRWKIQLSILLAATYTAAMVWLLWSVGVWNLGHAKDTIYWFIFTAMTMIITRVTSSEHAGFAREIILDCVAPIILVEVVMTAHSFSLPVELALVPTLAFLVVLEAVANLKAEHARVGGCSKTVLGIIGFVVFGYGIYDIVLQFRSVFTISNAISILITGALSIGFIPFIYLTLVVSTYEQIFLRVDFGRGPPEVIQAAKWRIIAICGLSLAKLRQLQSVSAYALLNLTTVADLDKLQLKTSESSIPEPD